MSAQFVHGDTDKADVLIGAGGIKSAVRTALFGAQEPHQAGDTCWRGVCPRSALVAEGDIGESWDRGKRFGITNLTKDRVDRFSV